MVPVPDAEEVTAGTSCIPESEIFTVCAATATEAAAKSNGKKCLNLM
jgi:hypothetical protein